MEHPCKTGFFGWKNHMPHPTGRVIHHMGSTATQCEMICLKCGEVQLWGIKTPLCDAKPLSASSVRKLKIKHRCLMERLQEVAG